MYDIVIIGGGPSGLTAAIYGARAGKKILVLEKSGCGGQIVYAQEVENYPGYIKISGSQLAEKLVEQVMSLGADIEYDEAVEIINNGDSHTVRTLGGEYQCRAVIIAAGARPRESGAEGETRFKGRGVSYCALCDGAFYRNKTVAVIGGGNTAISDAVYLSGICSKVYVIHRRDSFRAEKAVVNQLLSCDNVKILYDSVVETINGQDSVTGITIRNLKDNSLQQQPVEGVFVAVGNVPDTKQFDNVVRLDNNGYIVAGEDCSCDIRGIYAAGDCRNRRVKQLTTAVADGAVAAIEAVEYIE